MRPGVSEARGEVAVARWAVAASVEARVGAESPVAVREEAGAAPR